jgi:hypothetical protein
MRRWLALLLIALLPIQASWAAISAACADTDERSASHFGHHAHDDAVGAAPADEDPGEAHLECPTCHGIGLAVPLGVAAQTVGELPGVPAAFTAPSLPRPPPGSLMRPPALRVA